MKIGKEKKNHEREKILLVKFLKFVLSNIKSSSFESTEHNYQVSHENCIETQSYPSYPVYFKDSHTKIYYLWTDSSSCMTEYQVYLSTTFINKCVLRTYA